MGVMTLIRTCDPTQIQSINGRPLPTSPNIIPCYKIEPILTSIRAQEGFFLDYKKLLD